MSDFNTRQTLLQKLQNQYDSAAWDEFFLIYEKFIFAVVRKMKIDLHDAEDITQKVLLQAWKKLPDFDYNRQKGRFRSWLTTIARNQARMEMRSKYRHFDNPSSERHEELAQLVDSWTEPEIEKIAQLEWQKYIVAAAWANVQSTLGPKMLKVYELLTQGVALADVAKTLDLEENSVYRYRTRVEKQICLEVQRLEQQLG